MASPSPARTALSTPSARTAPRVRRRGVALLLALGAALPASVLGLAGSGTAAPTLTLQQVEARVADLQQQTDLAVERFDAGRIAAQGAARAATAAAAQARVEQAVVTHARRGLAGFATLAYETGGTDTVSALLTSTGTDFLDRETSLGQIAKDRSAQLLALRDAQVQLSAVAAVASARAADAARAARSLAAAQQQVQALLAAQQRLLSGLRADERARLAALQAAANRAAAEAASRSRALLALSLIRPVAAAAPVAPVVAASDAGRVALSAAYSKIGDPYVYGAAGPDTFDCSGLVMWAFAHAGISLPHNAAAQYGYGTHVAPAQLQPGDIVFFDEGGYIGHDGIYVGNGQFLDANHSGGSVGVRNLYPGLIGGTRL